MHLFNALNRTFYKLINAMLLFENWISIICFVIGED